MLKNRYNVYFLVGILLALASITNFIIQDVLTGFSFLAAAFLFLLLGYLDKSKS